MRPSCVNCHNTHPTSPKTDWKTGDVRGVLEVILPLDIAVAQTHQGLRGTFALMAVMSVLGLSGLALVIGRLRRSSTDLDQRARRLESEIAERQRVEALRESEGKYRHIINAAADAIISLDEHGLVCEFNSAAEQMFGFTKAELLGKPLTPIMPPHLRDSHTAGLQRYLTTGQRHLPHWHNIELPGCTKDGREFPWRSLSPSWRLVTKNFSPVCCATSRSANRWREPCARREKLPRLPPRPSPCS